MKKIFLMCVFCYFCFAQTDILIFGDSNTYGSASLGTHPQDKTFGAIVARNLEMQASVRINGRNGRTISLDFPQERFNGSKSLQKMLKKRVPDILVIMLGTNDLLNGAQPNDSVVAFEKMVDFAKNAGVKKIVIIAPPILELSKGEDIAELKANSIALNAGLENLARNKNLAFIDASKIIGRVGEIDEIHLSLKNHADLGQKLYEVLSDMIMD